MVNDMYAESGNDECQSEYREIASQSDFDNFYGKEEGRNEAYEQNEQL